MLKSIGDWSYVESGDVRGFIPSSELESGSDTTEMVDLIGEKGFETATPDIEIADNMAFTYTQTTTKDVLTDKDSALVLTKAEVLEYPKENARAVGEVKSGSLVYILAEPQDEKDWYFVESGDVRGFIRKSDLFSGGSVASIIQDSGDESLATQLISPEDNRSLYFSLKSVRPAASSMGEEIAEYATTFVGKIPYIWGGTSLSYGAMELTAPALCRASSVLSGSIFRGLHRTRERTERSFRMCRMPSRETSSTGEATLMWVSIWETAKSSTAADIPITPPRTRGQVP